MSALRTLGTAAVVVFLAGCAAQPPARPQNASEPGMLFVGGGRFTMGRDKGELNEQPAHKVKVGSFAMDRTEVAASEFAEFLNESGNDGDVYFTPDDYSTVVVVSTGESTREIRFAARPGYARFPANNVSWYGADAYCRWRGKRLPTEAEWEKAARGTDKRPFPWGRRDPGPGLAQFGQVWQEKQFGVLAPVDAHPEGASPYGMLNMAGNVLEWVADWYRQNYCDFCDPTGETTYDLVLQLADQTRDLPDPRPAQEAQIDASGAEKRTTTPRDVGSFKVLRGGAWQDGSTDELTVTHRFWLDPAQRFPHTGFRCSKDEAPESQ